MDLDRTPDIGATFPATPDEVSAYFCYFTCFNPSKTEFLLNNIYEYKSSSPSQETHPVTATKPNRLMLFGETVAVYCENHTEHTDTLCEQNAEIYYVKAGGTYSNQWILKS
jgi:hypothetical protein